MVADLVRDHIGHGEVAGRPEAPRQFVEESGVDVNLGVVRAVEGTHHRLAVAARGLCPAAVGDHGRRHVALARLGENPGPGFLGRAEDPGQEILHVRVERRPARRRARRRAARQDPTPAAELRQGAIADEQDQDSNDPEAAEHERQQAAEHVPAAPAESAEPAALSGPILEVRTRILAAQTDHLFSPRCAPMRDRNGGCNWRRSRHCKSP